MEAASIRLPFCALLFVFSFIASLSRVDTKMKEEGGEREASQEVDTKVPGAKR